MKSYKPEFQIQGQWYDNAVRFATYEEALANARDKYQRWTVPTDYRAVSCEDPPNYRYVNGQLEAL